MRAAALARFEAEEWRKEAVWALVDDMRKNVPGRKSMMGSPTWSGMHEVTQKQWTALMDGNPSRFRGDDLPVDSLTLGACLEFLERLNATSVAKAEDLKFRLPAAWEWEEVAERMPTGTPEERLAAGWFVENAGGGTHPVGGKAEGGHRCDLFGNVRELTYTWGRADGKEGLLCLGGSWADSAQEEGIPVSVLEQPRFIRRHLVYCGHAAPGADTMPSDYPHAVCPAPGQIGLRLWAERRTRPADERQKDLEEAAAYWESGRGMNR
jgi:formylglycine-generating enzyme required for sulfatase activity